MRFSASFACPRCLIRFERRARCPECGGPKILALATYGERRAFWRAVRKEAGDATPLWLARIGEWLMRLLLATRFVPQLAERSGHGGANETARVLRVAPLTVDPTAKRRTLKGRARLAAAECVSPIGDEPCIAFGLVGEVAGVPVEDADGGDFDLELESGDLVHVSLAHAVLEAKTKPVVDTRELGTSLGELLEARGVATGEATTRNAQLAEVLLRDGAAIEVDGAFEGGAAVRATHAGGAAARVFAGTESAPLVVRLV